MQRFSARRGAWLAVKRLGYHPLGQLGYDPVPEPDDTAASKEIEDWDRLMPLDRALLDIICCPVTRTPLELLSERDSG